MQVKSIAVCTSILQYFRPSLSFHLSLRSLFCLILSGRFTKVLLYLFLRRSILSKQTMKTLIKCPVLQHFIWVFSVCKNTHLWFFHESTEMPTLNAALQEYERHFSGIWGHFPECLIFPHKNIKCTHTSFL